MSAQTSLPILSPCVGICRLDVAGICEGCKRSGDEIARWIAMSPDQRAHLMDVVLPARDAESE